LLDRFGAKAVFFVIGEKVREFPELAREIVARGHELGNHTMTHPQASMWCAGPVRTRREISDCQRAIEEVAGLAPRWFRAPVGHRNFFTHPVTSELGLEVVAWTRRAFDTVETDVEKMTSRRTDDLEDGDVLLMHQGTPVSVELLAKVLERLKVSGLLEDDQVVVEGSAAPEG
jgi:peptidoglycan/xylan/chitin deacetylase (PgdA/CDA1 family)